MKVEFKQHAQLDGTSYKLGIHEVPDSLSSDWYFKALLKDNLIVIHVDKDELINQLQAKVEALETKVEEKDTEIEAEEIEEPEEEIKKSTKKTKKAK